MALVAFEMARLLNRQGQDVSLIALIEPSPIGPIHRAPTSVSRYYAGRVLYHVFHLAKVYPKFWPNYIRMRLCSIRRRIVARFLELANQPDRLDALSLMERAISAYTPEAYPGRVTLFLSSERAEESSRDTDFGWSDVAGGGLDVRIIPGDHWSIFHEPNIRILAKELSDLLA